MIQTKKEHEENLLEVMRAIMYFSIDTKITKEQEERLINSVQLSKRLIMNDMDNIFIAHIESHDEVKNSVSNKGKAICKICNKTAVEIYKKVLK